MTFDSFFNTASGNPEPYPYQERLAEAGLPQAMLEHWGPFRLAYLESLLRAADCRASREEAR